MLERYAMKVARTVLRGGSGIAATPLPDHTFAALRQVGFVATLRVKHFSASSFSTPRQKSPAIAGISESVFR